MGGKVSGEPAADKGTKKRARKSDDAPTEATPAVPSDKKHRKKRRTVDESQLPKEEQERRRVQRELRDLAMKLRVEGKGYKPQKYKRKLYVTEGAGKARRERKKEKTTQKKSVRVVVLPIFWEQRAEEMEAVLGAAKKVEDLLACLGVRVVTDNNNNFKPGERMKHWETLGVPIRVEIGPQDVKKGSCVVAVAGEPGTVAKKTTVKMSEQLVKQVQRSLREAGIETQRTEASTASASGDTTAAAAEAPGKKTKRRKPDAEGKEEQESASEEEEEEEEGGSDVDDAGSDEGEKSGGEPESDGVVEAGGSEEEAAAAAPVQPLVGGDDMDDFELEIDAEEEALTMNKKEIAKKQRQESKAKRKAAKLAVKMAGRGDEEEAPGWQDQVKAKKGPSKLVVFK